MADIKLLVGVARSNVSQQGPDLTRYELFILSTALCDWWERGGDSRTRTLHKPPSGLGFPDRSEGSSGHAQSFASKASRLVVRGRCAPNLSGIGNARGNPVTLSVKTKTVTNAASFSTSSPSRLKHKKAGTHLDQHTERFLRATRSAAAGAAVPARFCRCGVWLRERPLRSWECSSFTIFFENDAC